MADLMDEALQRTEIYGWCGLCHSFTGFPHDCAAQDQPAEDELN
jgi:hypothetical protein